MKGTNVIATYNMLGGTLEGFAVPVGLYKWGASDSQIGGGGSLCGLTTPDVTDVTAIPKGLYEKMMDLAKYGASNVSNAKKRTKGHKRKSENKKTRKL
jgi:hypothetical protein